MVVGDAASGADGDGISDASADSSGKPRSLAPQSVARARILFRVRLTESPSAYVLS